MRATRAALKTIQMTDTEREMNGDLLRQLQGNRDLQEKIRYKYYRTCCTSLMRLDAYGSLIVANDALGRCAVQGLPFPRSPHW